MADTGRPEGSFSFMSDLFHDLQPLRTVQPVTLFFLIFSLLFSLPLSADQNATDRKGAGDSVADTASLTAVTLQLPWLHQFEFAGFYAAIDKGFYREEGLEVSLKEAHAGVSIVDEVVSGRAEYGLANADLFASWGRGAPVVLLANLFKHSPLVILARQESGIRQPRDLVGKRLMTQQPDLNSAEISYMLYRSQVRPEQFVRVPHTFRIDELVSGEVDAMTAYITNQAYELQVAGVATVVIDPANYGADFYSNNLFTSQKAVREHPEQVAAFRRASLKGWRYALEHPAEIVDLILRQYSQRKSPSALHFEAREVAKLIAQEVYPLGSIDLQRLRRLQEVYLLSGAMTNASDDLQSFIWRGKDEPQPDMRLTRKERAFIRKHPQVRLCAYPGWLPYEGVKDGASAGIGPDLLRQALTAAGLEVVDVVAESWNETLIALKERRCDLISAIVASPDRQPLISFTESFIDASNAIVTRDSQAYISDIRELKGKHLGVLAGGIHEELLLRYFPDIQLKNYPSMDVALNALSKGAIDGFIDTVAASGYGIRRSGLDNLHIAGLFPYKTSLSVGVRSDWPELRNLTQKAYDSFPEGRMNEIIRHWVQVTAEPQENQTVLLRSALIVLLLMAVFLMFYSRLRRANRALAKEVVQRRKAEEATLRLNDELISKNQQLETLSRTDALTGLRNRYHIENTLEDAVIHCLSRQRNLSVMLLDLDRFKAINDRFGHNTGDQVLKSFANILKQFCHEHLLAGRWGGEEFLLILPETNLDDAHQIAERIRHQVASCSLPDVGGLTVSIGVAELRPDENAYQIISRVDRVLYQAKSAGRNCVVVDTSV